METITAKIHIFGNNIDTDQIYPGKYLEITDPQEIASHCLEGAEENFAQQFVKGEIVIGGKNFGCGSSREHAAIALKTIGVSVIIAKSFARIFYRNVINMGLMAIVCNDLDVVLKDCKIISLDIKHAKITNQETGVSADCELISDYAMKIINAGGIKSLLKEK